MMSGGGEEGRAGVEVFQYNEKLINVYLIAINNITFYYIATFCLEIIFRWVKKKKE